MASQDLQILIVVDIYPGVSVEELKAELPAERDERIVLQLTRLGAPQLAPPPDTSPIDWPAIGKAVEEVAAEVHELQASRSNTTVVFIAGKGPLAVFVHLGYKFTKSVHRTIVLNQPHGGGRWEPFAIESTTADESEPLDEALGVPSEPLPSDGRVGIAFDTAGRGTDKGVFASFIKDEGDPLAGVMQLRSSQKLLVTQTNMGPLVRQLAQFMSMAPARYPDRRGIAIFAGVPAQVAFAIGKAMSPNVVGKSVWLTEYRQPNYELAYSLPFRTSTEAPLPKDAASVLARRKVLDAMMNGIKELRRYLKPDHLPKGILPEGDREKYIARLNELELPTDTTEDEPFALRVIEGRYTMGAGILQALVNSTVDQQQSFAKLVLLHELLHDWQTLRSTNYTSIGRASFVLEQVDYAADVFALQALMNMELDIDGKRAHGEVSKRLRGWIDMILHGIQSFDLMEQGVKMERLPERRLRRYLLWHLHLARAATVKQADHVEEMLRPALTVELAPLAGRIDTERYDKVVTRAVPETELFIAIGGHLVRAPRRPGFEPGTLVEAVRNYAREPIQKVMVAVVDEHRSKLARWNT